MNIFIDTSAVLSVLDENEPNHTAADKIWLRLLDENHTLLSTNYIIREACALLQRRLGMLAVRVLLEDMAPVLQIAWVDQKLHADAVQAFLIANRRLLSLVDCVSFAVMRRSHISTAFAFDHHFEEQGFTCLR